VLNLKGDWITMRKRNKKNFKVQLNEANYKKLVRKQIEEKLLQQFGEVDPEYLKSFMEAIEREVDKKVDELKDTEDYNLDSVSSYVDQSIMKFMEAGQESILPGDLVKFDEKVQSDKKSNATGYDELMEAIDTGEYKKYPFNRAISEELRGIFLLKTSSKDTYKNLMEVVDEKIVNFMSQKDWDKIKACMEEAKERIFEEDVYFLNPLEGRTQGDYRALTAEECEKWGMDPKDNLMVDVRKDNHDLVALKELSLIVQGEDVHQLSIGPGFFGKYMPEMKKAGIDGLIFHIVDSKLKAIHLHKMPCKPNGFSVTDASYMLSSHIIDNNEDFFEGERFYVVVDGGVGGSSEQKHLEYEDYIFNEKCIPAAETYLFESFFFPLLRSTRLYFTPYKSSDVHPYYQHGSVIFGSNDQTFHSCVNNENFCYGNLDGLSEEELNDYFAGFFNLWKDYTLETEGENQYEPASVAGLKFAAPEGENYMYFRKKTEETDEKLKKILLSIYGENEFTKIYWKSKYEKQIKGGEKMSMFFTLLFDMSTLNQRFLIKDYVLNNDLSEKQKSFYKQLAEKMKYNDSVSLAFHKNSK